MQNFPQQAQDRNLTMETLTSASLTPSVCNFIPSHTTSLENNNNSNLRDASFSSYLNVAGNTFADKLAKSCKSLNSLFLERSKESGEINVFGAEKYFNGGVDDEENPKVANNKEEFKLDEDEPINHRLVKPKVCTETPSIHSESSWNSRGAMLKEIPRNHPSRRKYLCKSFLASISCGRCSCNDKNSVDIDEQIHESSPFKRSSTNRGAHGKTITKKPIKDGVSIQYSSLWEEEKVEDKEKNSKKNNRLGLRLSAEHRFTSSVVDSEMGNLAVKMRLQEDEDDDNERRKSLEVFGSAIIEKGKKHSSVDRRFDMFSCDVLPRSQFEEIEVPESSNAMYNEIESDSSSDLFEILSFSNNTNSCITRQRSDSMSSSVTPACYAPSEAA